MIWLFSFSIIGQLPRLIRQYRRPSGSTAMFGGLPRPAFRRDDESKPKGHGHRSVGICPHDGLQRRNLLPVPCITEPYELAPRYIPIRLSTHLLTGDGVICRIWGYQSGNPGHLKQAKLVRCRANGWHLPEACRSILPKAERSLS